MLLNQPIYSQPSRNVNHTSKPVQRKLSLLHHRLMLQCLFLEFSNASCTINCLAPLAKFVHEKFGIDRGSVIVQTSFELGRDTADERSNQVFH
jgi:hypothetical protein